MPRSTALMLRIALSVLTALSLVHLAAPRSLAEPTEHTRLLKVLPDGQEVHVRRVTTFEMRTAEQAGVPDWEGMWQIDQYLLQLPAKTGTDARVLWRYKNGFPTDSTKTLKGMKVFDVLDATWDDKSGMVLVANPPDVWVFGSDAVTGRTTKYWQVRRIPGDRDYTLRSGRILGDDKFSLVLPDGTAETWALKYTGNEMYDDGKESELVSRQAPEDPKQPAQDAGSQNTCVPQPEAETKAPRMIEAALYGQGDMTGEVHVDLVGREIKALRPPRDPAHYGASKMELCSSALSEGEVQRVLKLAGDEALRQLSPERKWFRQPREPWEYSPSVLLLRWDDKVLSLRVAGDLLLRRAPESARSAYERISSIGRELLALERLHRYPGSRALLSMDSDDPQVKKLLSDKNEAYRLAEPGLIW